MTSISKTRSNTVTVMLADVQEILADQPLSRELLASVQVKMVELAGRTELWKETDFPQSEGDVLHARYQIAQSDELTLYLNVMRPGNKTPPHNHTTWACIAAVAGVEQNIFYERIDDRAVAGKAELKRTAHISVAPESAISMMPDDIHHVEITGDQTIRHLHLYGRPLESLDERLCFDMLAGTCKVMDIGVKSLSIPSAGQEQ